MTKLFKAISMAVACSALGACNGSPDANVPGDTADEGAYSGIPGDAAIKVYGTEPFWGGTVENGTFTYTTPDDQDGTRIAVTRFAGRGGLSFSGELDGRAVDLAVTPGNCSDGMSDRTYPFNATLQIGADQRYGCAGLADDDLGTP